MNDDNIMEAIVYFSGHQRAWENSSKEKHYTHAVIALKYLLANNNLMTRLIKEGK